MVQMRKITLSNNREVVVFWKEDGNPYEQNHVAHTQFISASQIHGNNVLIVEHDHNHFWKHFIDADALFTAHEKPIGVYVADCLPVVLVWEKSHAIVHCSWRTLHGWLLQKTLECFHHYQDTVYAVYLWPCIKWYEVWEEFDQYFPEQFLQSHGDKYLFDLPWYTLSILDAWWIGPDSIIIDNGCTWNDTELYWSYRRGARDQGNFVGVRKLNL